MKKSKLIMLMSLCINKNEVVGTPYSINQNQKADLANVVHATQQRNNTEDQFFFYKLMKYATYGGILGLAVLTIVNILVDNTVTETITGSCNPTTLTCNNNVAVTCSANTDCADTTTETSAVSIAGIILQAILFALSFITTCFYGGFDCRCMSISKLFIMVYGLVLGALCFAGEGLSEKTLAGFTGNGNPGILGYLVAGCDIILQVVNFAMICFYHFLMAPKSGSYQKI